MPPAIELFVPGRVCLFGEHSDWAGGWRRSNPRLEPGCALLVGTNQGLHARIGHLASTLRWHASDEAGGQRTVFELPMRAPVLLVAARAGGFDSYVAGTAYQLLQRYPGLGGADIDDHHTDLPVAKGLSSSAAACVLTVRAFDRLHQLSLSRADELELAYLGETTTPSQCGRLDQGCAYGNQPVAMRFDGDQVAVEPISVGATLHLVLVDLGAAKDTRRILARLNACYPATTSAIARDVQRALGPENLRLTAMAKAALTSGDASRLGALMVEAQAVFDRLVAPACPEQLTAPTLHRVLAHPSVQPLIHGGKGVGSQGEGTAQLLCRDIQAQRAVMDIVEGELTMKALPLTIAASDRGRN